MRAVVWGIFIILLLIIQAVLIPFAAIQGIKPDLLLVVVVSAGLLFGKEAGIGTGFFAGLLQDLASGNVFGLNLISKMAAGFLFGLAERKVFKENLLLPVLAMMLASVLNSLLILGFIALRGYHVEWSEALIHTVVPGTVYNMIVAVPIHQLFAKLTRKVNTLYA